MKIRSRGARFIALSLVAVAMFAAPGAHASAGGQKDSLGTDFWVTFMQNHYTSPTLTLFVTSPVQSDVVVEYPVGTIIDSFTLAAGALRAVGIPSAAQMTSNDLVQRQAVHVTATEEITVYGLNRFQYTTDAYNALPTDAVGTDYLILAHGGSYYPSEFAVVATHPNTIVTITPSVAVGPHPAGAPFNVTLQLGDSYQLQGSDLTGSSVTSSAPVSVFAGNICANIPAGYGYCDHIVEQLPSTDTWGRSFVTVPLSTRTGDTFRILAQAANTHVQRDGVPLVTLSRGQFFETIITTGPSIITADAPILVAQYSNGSTWDGVTSDPFMQLVVPDEQWLAEYTVTTPASGFEKNFINLSVDTPATSFVKLDGTVISSDLFHQVGSSHFSMAQIPIELGVHHIESPLPIGTTVYGFDRDDSYGYPGGASFSPIARVDSLILSPETQTLDVGQTPCVAATVRDQFRVGLEGIRVDYTTAGANPFSGFALTGASGVADLCYPTTHRGTDTLTARVAFLSATATIEILGAKTVFDASPVVLAAPPPALFVPALSATLLREAGRAPIPGEQVTFHVPGAIDCVATTDASGLASCADLNVYLAAVVNLGYSVTYGGSDVFDPSGGSAGLIRLAGTDLPCPGVEQTCR